MKKFIQRIVLALTAVSMVSVMSFAPAYAVANPNDAQGQVCAGAAVAGAGCSDNGTSLNGVVKAILNILSIAVGIAAVVMIILAGLKYITSGGEASNVSSAKNSLLYAIIGLVIVALAQTIVRFVLSKA